MKKFETVEQVFSVVMEHVRANTDKPHRVAITAPTRSSVDTYFRKFLALYPDEWSDVGIPPMKHEVRHKSGGVVSFLALADTRKFYGPQFSLALKILTPELAAILESLSALGLCLRLDPAENLTVIESPREPVGLKAHLAEGGEGPPAAPTPVQWDDGACPTCGGTWPTCCSCPPGSEFVVKHTPIVAHGWANNPPQVVYASNAPSPFLPVYAPVQPHRMRKLDSGHVVCVDCIVGSAVFSPGDGPGLRLGVFDGDTVLVSPGSEKFFVKVNT